MSCLLFAVRSSLLYISFVRLFVRLFVTLLQGMYVLTAVSYLQRGLSHLADCADCALLFIISCEKIINGSCRRTLN